MIVYEVIVINDWTVVGFKHNDLMGNLIFARFTAVQFSTTVEGIFDAFIRGTGILHAGDIRSACYNTSCFL